MHGKRQSALGSVIFGQPTRLWVVVYASCVDLLQPLLLYVWSAQWIWSENHNLLISRDLDRGPMPCSTLIPTPFQRLGGACGSSDVQ